ncbi:murein L,D-transpeptidase catalytic domain family protein [Hymenobacter cheonanensis]|uniref:murein L,D-transpeptidase catalytic domain family protein n=1 Tax=Hymenobacter sp. CA2-7 TaxID=3063993 RepID=UPI0027127000|nr:murein L,D-transpeptidase catalytic domain family protein [Hymenobacter sp. CA2-7]MDO7887869.1 murein L,D-transpeptidase catalytic domain family protein [Hymenobacter sp. CA2-7]
MKKHHHSSVVQRQRDGRRRSQRLVRRVLPFVASLFLATPLAGPLLKSSAHAPATTMHRTAAIAATPLARFDATLRETYDRLGAEQQGLRFEVFQKAMTGYLNLRETGHLAADQQHLTVVDFDLPSTEKRLWVLDLASDKILFHTLVAHGHNSGENGASQFSNTNESNMSSLGFYVTGNEYEGKHGHSLRLQGVDEGFNTNAFARSIVMHGADYVSEDFIKQNGRLGRSLGCPALPLDQYAQIIDQVKGGSCLFLSKSNAGYTSKYLNQDIALAALSLKPATNS